MVFALLSLTLKLQQSCRRYNRLKRIVTALKKCFPKLQLCYSESVIVSSLNTKSHGIKTLEELEYLVA